jgi:ribosomal 50S subunit-recycling heat shock protein
MRIDKFLKVSRIIKRRTVAAEACDGGRVLLNGKPVKAGAQVAPGMILEVAFGSHTARYEILAVAESMPKEGAASLVRPL